MLRSIGAKKYCSARVHCRAVPDWHSPSDRLVASDLRGLIIVFQIMLAWKARQLWSWWWCCNMHDAALDCGQQISYVMIIMSHDGSARVHCQHDTVVRCTNGIHRVSNISSVSPSWAWWLFSRHDRRLTSLTTILAIAGCACIISSVVSVTMAKVQAFVLEVATFAHPYHFLHAVVTAATHLL